tara:strand:+ start:839 stop:1558 length:720 start_codon:yes stop_codon:yes gene_type:complete
MGKVAWSWSKVAAGQVIRFRYNEKMRTVIVMMSPYDPGSKDKNLLHALQIVEKNIGIPGMKTKLPLIIRKSGGVQLVLEDKRSGKFFKFNFGFVGTDRVKPKSVYNQLKGLFNSKEMYKTYSWEKCKRSAVQLNNDELNEYNIPIDMLAEAGVIPSEKKPPIKPKPKTFDRKQRKARYKPGDVWKRVSGKWAGKNLDKEIRGFKTKEEAEFWAESTTRTYKVKQIQLAQKKSNKDIDNK